LQTYKKKILLLTGDLLKHQFVALNILKKFQNAKIIFEKYPKETYKNYTKKNNRVISKHFENVDKYENFFFLKTIKKNTDFIKKNTLATTLKGKLESKKLLNIIKKYSPELIIINATSLITEKLLSLSKNVINIHAGLMPYYRGSGCNVWTFFNQELEYTGVTIHFVDDQIDGGKIILQGVTKFCLNDNTHSVGCKNAILASKLAIKSIAHMLKYPKYKGIKIRSKKTKIYYKKHFNHKTIEKINRLVKEGLVKNFIKKKIKKVKIISKLNI